MGSLQALKRLTETLVKFKESRSFNYSCLEKIRVISADDDRCVFELTVEQRHSNTFGTLHNGCVATLLDVVSSINIIACFPNITNRSTNLTVSFLDDVNVGEDILIEAKNLMVGKTFGFQEMTIRRKRDGQLVATGSQRQFIKQLVGLPKQP